MNHPDWDPSSPRMKRPSFLGPPPDYGPVENSYDYPHWNKPMAKPTSEQILDFLRQHKPFLQRELGVEQIALFGSALDDQLEEESDIDILVGLKKLTTMSRVTQERLLQRYLEDRLHRTVDITERGHIYPHLAPYIEGTAYYV